MAPPKSLEGLEHPEADLINTAEGRGPAAALRPLSYLHACSTGHRLLQTDSELGSVK